MLALLQQARLLVSGLASADRTLLLLVIACAEGHLVALAAATPVVGTASCWFMAGWCLYVLGQARICGAVIGHDVSLAWMNPVSTWP